MTRWRVTCDGCGAGGWIGPRHEAPAAVFDAWCEGCQRPHALTDRPPPSAACPRCEGPLTLGEPRFEELLGDAQNLAAVLHAWCGDPGPLAALLPDRPRFLDEPIRPEAPPAELRVVPAAPVLVGDHMEARWNRAATLLIRAVASSQGMPDAATIRAARAEAGEPSPYRSDHTVGRLLWTLLIERAITANRVPTVADGLVLRSAEQELEFRTFWDRALVVQGYAVLGMKAQAGDAAAALAEELLGRLAAEPFARGPAGAWLSAALAVVVAGVRERRPGDALAAVRTLMERPDVSRYRVPCNACGHGSLGVESLEDKGHGD